MLIGKLNIFVLGFYVRLLDLLQSCLKKTILFKARHKLFRLAGAECRNESVEMLKMNAPK